MKRGEIWWVETPDVDCRPHLILTRDQAIPALHRVITIPTTRTMRGIPTEVSIGQADGLPDECVLTCDNISATDKVYFLDYITTLGPDKLDAACKALAAATACS